jgi:hypothetical protein
MGVVFEPESRNKFIFVQMYVGKECNQPEMTRLANNWLPKRMPTDILLPSKYWIVAQPGPRIGTTGNKKLRQQ